jgi:tetratricopeptide (TPR) repeat protein
MTRRTPPAPRSTDPLAVLLRALALAACLAPAFACGAFSRQILARNDASESRSPEDDRALLGADPMIAPLWLWSAQRQPSPEESLAVLERGRQFHPGDPELKLAQAELLHLMDRDEDMEALALGALQSDCPVELESGLRWMLILGRLAANDVAAAEAEAARLAGVRGVPPPQLADAWARIAAAQEFLGRPELADAALEKSLDWGPDGLFALREVVAREPQRKAACDALLERARARHPGHPDLVVQQVFTALIAMDAAAAQQALDTLPTPLPERLEPTVELQRVRVDLLAGRSEDALAVLRRRLDDNPADGPALAVLIEGWRLRQVPSKDEMRVRLSWASRRTGHPGLEAQIQAVLRELGPAPQPDEPAEPAP